MGQAKVRKLAIVAQQQGGEAIEIPLSQATNLRLWALNAAALAAGQVANAAVAAANTAVAAHQAAVAGVLEIHGITRGEDTRFEHAADRSVLTVPPAPPAPEVPPPAVPPVGDPS